MLVNVQDLRTTIRREVPSSPGAWVDFYSDTTVAAIHRAEQAEELSKNGSVGSKIDGNLVILLEQIVDWNFSDNDDQKLPITLESLNKLPMKLLQWLASTQQDILSSGQADKKKDLPEISPQR